MALMRRRLEPLSVLPAGLEIRPRVNEVPLCGFKGELEVEVGRPETGDYRFSIDVWSFQPQVHPANHLGWWHIPVASGRRALKLVWDLSAVGPRSLRVYSDGAEIEPSDSWVNPAYVLTPLQDGKLVFWNGRDEIVALKRFLIKSDDPAVLKAYYMATFAAGGYSSPGDAPFLELLHRYKLGVLARAFRRYYRGRVLDVGCGRSLFTDIPRAWGFKIVAGDVVLDQIRARKAERPDVAWVVFDAARLPFKDGAFDGLFAGEILEHLPDPAAGLAEWNRVQKAGGTLIVTTPNRERRINRLNGEAWPVSPDHLRELSYGDLNGTLLPRNGYRPIRKRGLYLEARTWSNGWWLDDHLQRLGNTRRNRWQMKILLRAGNLVRGCALEMITVARKV